MSRDPRVDAYIEKAAPFARPLLVHFRELVHASCPEASEAMKWSFPHFVYKTKNVASMAAFKTHASIGFWYSEDETEQRREQGGMGHLGKLTGLGDLPPDAVLREMITSAMARIDSGAKPPWMERRKTRAPAEIPAALEAALAANPVASAVWAGFAPSHRREYADWVADAKREETRNKRVAQAIEWIADGKQRHWQYQKR